MEIVYGKEILDDIIANAPQLEIEESIKRKLWEDLDDMVQNIPMNEKLYIEGALNWHIGVCRSGYKNVYGNFSYRTSILDFALLYDLWVANTWFKKRDRTRENAT